MSEQATNYLFPFIFAFVSLALTAMALVSIALLTHITTGSKAKRKAQEHIDILLGKKRD